MSKTLLIFFACSIVCSCSEYKKQRAEEKAEIIKESNSLNNQKKKMEDSLYNYKVTNIDTVSSKNIIK